nr:AzlC family ABC transporter permease [Streptomyces sp. HNM0574]
MPVVLGYLPACLTFGLVGSGLGLDPAVVFALSALVYAGASQFIGAKMLAAGAAAPVILLSITLVNLRYALLAASFRYQLAPGISRATRALLGFGLTEEVYAVGLMGKDPRRKLTASYLLGLEIPPYLVTLGCTALGIQLARVIPEDLLPALNTSLYALLIALVLPQALASASNAAVCLLSAAASWAATAATGNDTMGVLAAMAVAPCCVLALRRVPGVRRDVPRQGAARRASARRESEEHA